jgi:flotillin
LICKKGQAEAMYAKLEAEAKGQMQMFQAKAEGLKLIVNACGGSQQAFQLMMLEHIDKLSENAAKSISNIKFDKIVVWDSGSDKTGANATSNFIRGVANSLPPALHLMKDIAGVEMPKYFGNIMEDASEISKYEQKNAEVDKAIKEAAKENNWEKVQELNKEKERLIKKLEDARINLGNKQI